MNNRLSRLLEETTCPIRDALWKDIRFSPSFLAILRTAEVQKLAHIQQLGPVSIVYPSAVHTRLDHSIGVYHHAFQIMLSLLRGDQGTFTDEGIHGFLCAALLHDIGHFPYAHALKELSIATHEQLAAALILSKGELNDTIRNAGIDPSFVAAIIDETIPSFDKELLLYRSILSGTLDPDKLDYLNRDAFFCGVPYGMQDASYITGHLVLRGGNIALEEEAIASVEHVLFAKYLMYRNVYWHRGTRSATAMVKEAVLTLLEEGAIKETDMQNLDDAQFFSLLKAKGGAASRLAGLVRQGRTFVLVDEKDHDDARPLDRMAKGLAGRMETERKLEVVLSLPPHSLVVDIPEPISFEASIPILKSDGTISTFQKEDQLFQSDISSVFAKCLRKTRIYCERDIGKDAMEKAVASLSSKG
jgi:HD superfamily phosphohydrolase